MTNAELTDINHEVNSFLKNFSARPHHAWILKGPHHKPKKEFLAKVSNHFFPDLNLQGHGDWEDKMHPNFLYVSERHTEKSAHSIDHIRSITKFVAHTSADGGWKVIVIDSLNDLNRNGENGLLKTLESPPEKTLFFLIHRVGKPILPTILSRCAQIPFGDSAQKKPLLANASETEEALFFLGSSPDLESESDYVELYTTLKDKVGRLSKTGEKVFLHQILDEVKRDEQLVALCLHLVDKWVKWAIKYKALDEEDTVSPFSHLSLDSLLSYDTYLSKLKRDYSTLGFDPKQAIFGMCFKLSQINT
ncbi:MAG: hypothetical protein H6925_05460 [Holosporaceae bacterium]|nr:MAG: hypothetical protein H6925_05460 [Holosporaceae bacterium]